MAVCRSAERSRMQAAAANGEAMLSPAQCNWSAVVETNIPDSRSKTCAGALAPEGLRYLIGNQLPKLWDRAPHYHVLCCVFDSHRLFRRI